MKRVGKRKDKGLSRTALYVLVVCSAFLTVGIVLLFFSMYAVYQLYDIPMTVNVSDRSSFNTDSDMINFGKAVPGNANTRTIVLSHGYGRPLLISFRESGNISRFVALPDEFYLEPGLSKEVSVSATIPKDAPQGRYDGTLTVYFRRV
jgi:hypothetical protein